MKEFGDVLCVYVRLDWWLDISRIFKIIIISIFKAQNLVPGDYSKRIHTHTHKHFDCC